MQTLHHASLARPLHSVQTLTHTSDLGPFTQLILPRLWNCIM